MRHFEFADSEPLDDYQPPKPGMRVLELTLAVLVPDRVAEHEVAELVEPLVRKALAGIEGTLEGFTIEEGEGDDV